jgi:pyridoxine 5-phosphate synthase
LIKRINIKIFCIIKVYNMTNLRLGINIDHVATLRNSRGGSLPDPIRAAMIASDAGADGITAHLREDRRHITDYDIERLINEIDLPLNFEMAATDEMKSIAIRHRPHATCIVPEKRIEITTEGGLDVIGQFDRLQPYCDELCDAGSRVSLFIEPNVSQIESAAKLGVPVIELHAGAYCDASEEQKSFELEKILKAAACADDLGLECHVGHGLNFENVKPIASIKSVVELNIGHFIIGEAVFLGLASCIQKMRALMTEARNIK